MQTVENGLHRWHDIDVLVDGLPSTRFLPKDVGDAQLEQSGPPVAPDIAVIKGVALRPLSSWRIGTTGPAPQVVLEILSPETWKKDLEEKPGVYAQMGVQEYFAYDPTPSPLAPVTRTRLFGWRADPLSGRMTALVSNEDGSLWSEELASFLLPDGQLLRLADRHRQRRLTQAEALAEKLRSLGVDPDQL